MYHKNSLIAAKVRAIPAERKFLISETVSGELEGGHEMSPSADQIKIAEFWKWVDEHLFRLEPSDDTSRKYGAIIGLLNQKYPRANDKHNQAWLQRIGVQINDVWFVAEGWSHNVICVTHDDMTKIKAVVGNNVLFDDWLR